MLKSMLIHRKDNKRIIKSNFVTSYLAFRGSIPIVSYALHIRHKGYGYYIIGFFKPSFPSFLHPITLAYILSYVLRPP